jgi:phage terminase large subunit|tara:strand:- start:7664 stop:8917 length:1254 start_codon:yes stop_codon:yes gene_type:complete
MENLKTIEIPIEYKPLFDKNWREAAVYGGRYSLKSHTVARFLLIKARESKTRVGCFREFQNSIADSSHQLLKELINKYELNEFEVTNNSILNKLNGSDFIFKGLHNNEQSVKSTEGIDIAWVEEAQTVSQNSIEVLTPTVRKEKSKIIYTYNRLVENDPVHVRLVEEGRPDTLVINVNYDIAIKYKMIPDVILKEIRDDKQNRPNLYQHKWLGEPNSLELKIFQNWRQIDDVPHEARLEARWLDFGYSVDESAIGSLYYYNNGWVLDEELYRKEMSNRQLATFLNALPKPQTLIVADSAEPKSIAELQSYGLNVLPCKKGKDSVNAGIQLVQDQPISVTKRSTNIWKEQLNYFWLVDKNGRIINKEDPACANHHMAGVRYVLSNFARLEYETSYSDRIWADELAGVNNINKQVNKGL